MVTYGIMFDCVMGKAALANRAGQLVAIFARGRCISGHGCRFGHGPFCRCSMVSPGEATASLA